MIFSKDKKPTQAGWYWFKYAHPQYPPMIIQIDTQRLKGSRLKVCKYGMPTINAFTKDWGVLWGDRLDLPTVEHDTDGRGE